MMRPTNEQSSSEKGQRYAHIKKLCEGRVGLRQALGSNVAPAVISTGKGHGFIAPKPL